MMTRKMNFTSGIWGDRSFSGHSPHKNLNIMVESIKNIEMITPIRRANKLRNSTLGG